MKFQISTDDIDGSEQLIQVIVEGIPNGLVINHLSIDGQPLGSVSFIGDNQWLIQIKPEDVRNLGSGKLDAAINFHVGDDLEKQDGTRIVIRPLTKDPGRTTSPVPRWNGSCSRPICPARRPRP